MKNRIKQITATALAALTALTVCACSTTQPESVFDNPRPWHNDSGSYEKLSYGVTVYDTTQGVTDDKRVAIASGAMTFELNESLARESTALDMRFSVTYNDLAPEADRGLTDEITSSVTFSTASLAAQRMEKTVSLADRRDAENLSYSLTADYHGDHTATYKALKTDAPQKTLELPKNVCKDNEMMLFLARAQTLTPGSSSMFRMVNIFESFQIGSITEYTIYSQTAADLVTLDLGDFVKDYGVEAVANEETGETTYPISCYGVSVGMSGDKSGPPYSVMYTEKPFVIGNKSHYKIPVRISYSEYRSNRAYRYTEYTLDSCVFEKPQA